MSSRSASASPTYAGERWKSPASAATRAAEMDCDMQASETQVAISNQTTADHARGMTTAPAVPAPPLADLGPLAQLRAGRLGRRLPQLAIGLVLYGVSLGLMVRGDVGLAPWDVLHSGLIEHVPMTLGQAVVLMSFVVLLLWIPLKEQPGIGTIANALIVGVSADATLWVLDEPRALAARVALMIGGVVLCGIASGLYIGAQLGRGPR